MWRMDFEDMDAKIKANHIQVAIFCSPHNPCGRVWERWELEKAMEVYRANDCLVISDEIWSDIILNGHKHIPTQSVSEDARSRTVALYAPSKTFNLAGLVGSYHIIYNPYLRDRVRAKNRMQYVSKEVSEALVSQITKGFGIDVNIIFGDIDIVADTPIGGIVAIFDGEPVRIDAALNYLRQRNIAAEVLKEGWAAWCVPAFGGYSIAIAYKRALTIAIPMCRCRVP